MVTIQHMLKQAAIFRQATFPSFRRRGGCAIKKKPRSHLISRRRGGRSRRSVSERVSETFARKRPPRPLHGRWLRDIFLRSRPPLLRKEGNVACLKIC